MSQNPNRDLVVMNDANAEAFPDRAQHQDMVFIGDQEGQQQDFNPNQDMVLLNSPQKQSKKDKASRDLEVYRAPVESSDDESVHHVTIIDKRSKKKESEDSSCCAIMACLLCLLALIILAIVLFCCCRDPETGAICGMFGKEKEVQKVEQPKAVVAMDQKPKQQPVPEPEEEPKNDPAVLDGEGEYDYERLDMHLMDKRGYYTLVVNAGAQVRDALKASGSYLNQNNGEYDAAGLTLNQLWDTKAADVMSEDPKKPLSKTTKKPLTNLQKATIFAHKLHLLKMKSPAVNTEDEEGQGEEEKKEEEVDGFRPYENEGQYMARIEKADSDRHAMIVLQLDIMNVIPVVCEIDAFEHSELYWQAIQNLIAELTSKGVSVESITKQFGEYNVRLNDDQRQKWDEFLQDKAPLSFDENTPHDKQLVVYTMMKEKEVDIEYQKKNLVDMLTELATELSQERDAGQLPEEQAEAVNEALEKIEVAKAAVERLIFTPEDPSTGFSQEELEDWKPEHNRVTDYAYLSILCTSLLLIALAAGAAYYFCLTAACHDKMYHTDGSLNKDSIYACETPLFGCCFAWCVYCGVESSGLTGKHANTNTPKWQRFKYHHCVWLPCLAGETTQQCLTPNAENEDGTSKKPNARAVKACECCRDFSVLCKLVLLIAIAIALGGFIWDLIGTTTTTVIKTDPANNVKVDDDGNQLTYPPSANLWNSAEMMKNTGFLGIPQQNDHTVGERMHDQMHNISNQDPKGYKASGWGDQWNKFWGK